MNFTNQMKTMQPDEQLDLTADEAALATALRTTLQQRAQTQQLAPEVRALVLAAVVPRRRLSWWWQPALAAAAVLLLMAGAIWMRSGKHLVTEFTSLLTIPDHTVRIEWKSPTHVVIQRGVGWKERRLMVARQNGVESYALLVTRPTTSLWK